MHKRLIPRLPKLSLMRQFSKEQHKSVSTPDIKYIERAVEDFKRLDIATNSTILLCVSGGSDSIAMLHMMAAMKNLRKLDLNLKVVNFNHKLRPESDQEAIFVEDLAKHYKMDFFSRILPEEKRGDNFSQVIGRSWRIAESLQILESLPGLPEEKFIATAHHMEDQMETILMKFLRGAHITHLQGVKLKNGNFIRPLLNFQKQELVDYLQIRELTWMEDSSNAERDYMRNKVRLDLIPLMSSLAGSPLALQKRLLTLAQQSTYVKEQVNEAALRIAKSIKRISYRNHHALYYANNTVQEEKVESDSTSNVEVNHHSPLDAFSSMPPLALETILFEWILAKTGIRLDHSKMADFIAFVQRPLRRGQLATSITISYKWDLMRCMNEIRLVLRGPNSGGVVMKSSSTWTSTVFGVDGATPEQPPVMVEMVHPTIVTVDTDMLDDASEDTVENFEKEKHTAHQQQTESHEQKWDEGTGDNNHLLNHIRESSWVCNFDFFLPVKKPITGKNTDTKQVANENDDEETEGLVYTIRPAELDDYIYHENLNRKLKVGNLVSKLHAERPNLGISRDRVLVVTATMPVKHALKRNKTEKNNHSQAPRQDDLHLFENSEPFIAAVLIPGVAIYSREYSRYVNHPEFAIASVPMQVRVHASPELSP